MLPKTWPCRKCNAHAVKNSTEYICACGWRLSFDVARWWKRWLKANKGITIRGLYDRHENQCEAEIVRECGKAVGDGED